MANINLSTSTAGYVNQRDSVARSGLISIFMILVFVLALYGGLIGWKKNLNNKIAAATKSYDAIYAELMSGMNIEVTDLQNRIFISKKLIKQDKLTRDVLEIIEKNIVSGVYLNLYDSNMGDHKLKLEGLANSYNDLSRQILSFKSSKTFSSVSLIDSKVLESGKISFSIEIKFK